MPVTERPSREATPAPEPPDEPPVQALADVGTDATANRLSAWERIGIPVAVAVLALLGSFTATTLANNTATENQRALFAEERASAEREKRADVYFAFLSAVEQYVRRASILNTCLASSTLPVTLLPEGRLSGCTSQINDISEAATAVTKALNEVYVYGSNAANEHASAIADALLVGEANLNAGDAEPPDRQGKPARIISFPFHKDQYLRHVAEFRRVVCREVPANPRSGC